MMAIRSPSNHFGSAQHFVLVVGELVAVTVEATVSVVGEGVNVVDLVKVLIEIDVTVTMMGDVKVIVEGKAGLFKSDDSSVE